MQFTLNDLAAAHRLVTDYMSPTPQHAWPLLAERVGAQVWVKHENHTPTGSFKVRGALTFIDWLKHTYPDARGICTATRGNHGQGQAWAATAAGLTAKVYVPRGNSVEKNAAMRAFGAELVEFGDDFDSAREEAFRVAAEEGLFIVPPFHRELVRGVATYGYELFRRFPISTRSMCPSAAVPASAGPSPRATRWARRPRSSGWSARTRPRRNCRWRRGGPVETESCRTFADGMAVRVPVPEALEIYSRGARRIVTVSDAEVAEAMRVYYTDTHNLAEGAGAAPLAALMQEKEAMAGRKVAVILCGGNIDRDWFVTVLQGGVPQV
jgi:threonine dehydratase